MTLVNWNLLILTYISDGGASQTAYLCRRKSSHTDFFVVGNIVREYVEMWTKFYPQTPPAVFTFYPQQHGYYDSLRRAFRDQLARVGALPACFCDWPWRFTNEGRVRLNQFPNCHEWNLHAQTRLLRCDPLGPYVSSWCTRTCLWNIDFLVTRLRMSGEVTTSLSLAVRSIVFSCEVYDDVGNFAGQLDRHQTYLGMLF